MKITKTQCFCNDNVTFLYFLDDNKIDNNPILCEPSTNTSKDFQNGESGLTIIRLKRKFLSLYLFIFSKTKRIPLVIKF